MRDERPARVLGFHTAFSVVVANMVGVGVFTTLGLQAAEVPNGWALLALWLVGGVIALCGALSYGELAAALPRSGGEYHFLGRIYHPVLGVIAGWVSVTVGFSAPVALAAMALGRYAGTFTPLAPEPIAVAAIVLVTAFHVIDIRLAQRFQIVTTWLKIAVIVSFCAVGLLVPAAGDVRYGPPGATLEAMGSPAFAVALIYVSYAFAGWNAATYIAGEIRDPGRIVPRALMAGTLTVTVFYLLLNLVFLRTVPMAELRGTIEVGALSAHYLFGVQGGLVMNAMLCLVLLSTISAMLLAGPRVLQVIGEDIPVLRGLAARSRGRVPLRAILFQQGLALLFMMTGSFEVILTYTGFTLTLISLLTVLGVFVLRRRAPGLPRPYRVWGYPLTPLLFIAANLLILGFVLFARPLVVLASLATLLAGYGLGVVHQRGARP